MIVLYLLYKFVIGGKYEKIFDDVKDKKLKNKYLADADYIKYDFEIMDSLKWLLDVSGYCLIKKNDK